MTDPLPSYRYPIEQQEPRVGHGGSAREAAATHFPVSQGLAGVSMVLGPGTLREMHWHANAAEWAYVISGNCRSTIYAPDGTSETLDFGPGDVWYFPRGHGHSIQGIGPGDCHFILVFDNGYFSEFATFSFSDWLGHTPPEVVAQNLRLPIATVQSLPKEEVYFAKGPIPGPLPKTTPPRLTHKYQLAAAPPTRVSAGGKLHLATEAEFPISTTMSGGTMTLHPGGLRELHWHPNSDEWQYIIAGKMRMTVFASGGRAETVDFGPGDVGYVPRGLGHYLQNVGSDECKVLLVFNAGDYQEISAADWIASNPRQLVATNLGMSEEALASLPKKSDFIDE